MATIIEMSAKHYPPTKDEKIDCLRTLERAAFRFGANAVLKEIESIIAVGCDDFTFDIMLRDKIKELKGE